MSEIDTSPKFTPFGQKQVLNPGMSTVGMIHRASVPDGQETPAQMTTDLPNNQILPDNEIRQNKTPLSPDSPFTITGTLVDARQSVRLPVANMPDMIAPDGNKQLTRQPGVVAKVMVCLSLTPESPSNAHLTAETLQEDSRQGRVVALPPFTIMDGRRQPNYALRGLASNPGVPSEQTALQFHSLINNSAVIGTRGASEERISQLLTLPGNKGEISLVGGLAINAAGDGVEVLPMTPDVMTAVQRGNIDLLGTIQVEGDGSLILSGHSVHVGDDPESRLPCLYVTTMQEPEYPYKLNEVGVKGYRQVLAVRKQSPDMQQSASVELPPQAANASQAEDESTEIPDLGQIFESGHGGPRYVAIPASPVSRFAQLWGGKT